MDYWINSPVKTYFEDGTFDVDAGHLVITSEHEKAVFIPLGEIYHAWQRYANFLLEQSDAKL